MKRKKDEGQAHSSLHLIVEQRVHDYFEKSKLGSKLRKGNVYL